MTSPAPGAPKRHWGWGLTFAVLAVLALGMGVGDFFVQKPVPGVVILGLAVAMAIAAVALFRRQFVSPPPEPPLGRWRLVAAIASGVLAGLAFPICIPLISHHEQLASGYLEVLAWVGLVPLYACIDGVTPRRALGLGLLAGMAFFNVTFWWVNVAMTTFGGIPNVLSIPVLEMLVGWCAMHWALACWSARYLQRIWRWPLWVALAVTWCASELMRNYFMSGYPWANLGYATSRDPWFSQVAALGGIYLIAFCLLLVNGAVYAAIAARREGRPLPTGALAVAGVIALGGHLYGAIRLHWLTLEIEAAPKVRVAVVQGNIDQKIKAHHDSYVDFILRQYGPQTDVADDEGADLIIWPEASYPGYFPPGAQSIAHTPLRSVYRANLLVGVGVYNRATNRASNSAFWTDGELHVKARYDKHHLVPFGEYVLWNLDRYLPISALVADVGLFTPGDDLPIWDVKLGPTRIGSADASANREVHVGMLICYDAIFPEISRTYAQEGADLLVNITNDAWYGFSSAPYQFLRMVEMRAIESGRSVARAANTGVSAFIDPAGRILAATELGLVNDESSTVDEAMHVPATHLVRDVPLLTVTTLYSVIGDAFAYGCAFLAVLGTAIGLRKAIRPPPPGAH